MDEKNTRCMTDKTDITQILLLNKCYVEHPMDMEELHDVLVPDAMANYAGMISIEKTGITDSPVFVFGSDIKLTNDYPAKYKRKLIEACEAEWPPFRKYVKRESLERIYNRIATVSPAGMEIFRRAMGRIPEIMIYPVPEPGDPVYGSFQDVEKAPYGVVLRRI